MSGFRCLPSDLIEKMSKRSPVPVVGAFADECDRLAVRRKGRIGVPDLGSVGQLS